MHLEPSKKRPWERLGTIVLISINLILLSVLSNAKNNRINSSNRLDSIREKTFLVTLDQWQIHWRQCSSDNCVDLPINHKNLTLPAPQEIQDILANQDKKANQVILTHKIPDTLLTYFRSKKAWINLVIPRSLHQGLTVKTANKSFPVHVGRGQTLQFTLHEKDFGSDQNIILIYNFDDLPWFGPSQIPIALVDDQLSQFYADTAAVLETKSLLNRDWHIALPLLVAALNLIINHSRIYSFLSLYLVFFSIRAICAMAFDLEILIHHSEFLLSALHIFANAALLQFSMLMLGYSSRRLLAFAQGTLFIISTIIVFAAGAGFIETLKIDLVFDIFISSYLGLAFCGLVLPIERLPVHKQIPFAKVNGKKIYGLSLFLLGISILCLGVDNISNLFHIGSGLDRTSADGFAVLHILLLSLSAFSRLGSTEKTIIMASKLQARHFHRSRERLAFQRFQREMLDTTPHYQAHDIAWQCHHQGLDQVSGDWHDLKHYHNWMTLALYDVTGHDLRATGHHLLIAAQWRLAVSRAIEQMKRESFSIEQARIILKSHLFGLQQMFSFLPHSAGASGICFFLDLKTGQACYVAAGHHGFIWDAGGNRRWIATPSSRLGASQEFLPHLGSLQLSAGDALLFFTDGNCQNQELGAYIEEVLNRKRFPQLGSISWEGRNRNLTNNDDRTQISLVFQPPAQRIENQSESA